MANPVVTFEMENGDIMRAELYPEVAPNSDRPLEKQVMKKVTVETFGEDYPEPETV